MTRALMTLCPPWCTDHAGGEHFGEPVEVAVDESGIQLGLEQREGRRIVALTGDGAWCTELSPSAATELAAALTQLAAQATATAQ